MSCCGGKKIKPLTQEERIMRLKAYNDLLKRRQCPDCKGVLQSFPGGVTICSVCRKRKN